MSSSTGTNTSPSGDAIKLPTEVMHRVAAASLRAFIAAKSKMTLEEISLTRLRPDARALLKMLIAADTAREPPKAIREIGRTADGLAFIKAEDGIVQRVEGDAETVLSAFVARAPGIGAYYARNVPHLVQLMRYNSGLLRGREQQPSVEAAPASAKRVAKKQRRK